MNMLAEVLEPEFEAAQESAPMVWLSRHVLHGRNTYHERTVIRVRVRLGQLLGRNTSSLPSSVLHGCIERFVQGAKVPPNAPDPRALSALLLGPQGLAIERLLLECVLLKERRLAFSGRDLVPISCAQVHPVEGHAGEVELVWSSRDPSTSASVSRLVVAEFNQLLAPGAGERSRLDAEHARLAERSGRRQVSTATSIMLLAAHERGLHADSAGGPTVQYGQGALQRLAHSSIADESLAAARLSRHKARTVTRLAQLGLPVPRHVQAQSIEMALSAAQRIGFPVVVKPLRGKQGSGVTVGVADAAGIVRAFDRAVEGASTVIVEELLRGATYRLLVIGGRFASAVRMDQPRVIGDGLHSVSELIALLNADPERDGLRLTPIIVDAEVVHCVEGGGRTLDSVPAKGQEVLLRGTSNFSKGSTTTEVSEFAHPAHIDLAERAASGLGLHTAGVDLISLDIALPPEAASSRIIEVNARPGLLVHTFPRHGASRDVGGQVLDTIFPASRASRVPTVLVMGRRGAVSTADAICEELKASGLTPGLASRQRCSIDGVPLGDSEVALHDGIARMWRDPRVQALVTAHDPRRAVASGLGLESGDIACLLPIDPADDAGEYRRAVALAMAACQGRVLARRGDSGVACALDDALRDGIVSPDSVHWVPESASRNDMAVAVCKLLLDRTSLH